MQTQTPTAIRGSKKLAEAVLAARTPTDIEQVLAAAAAELGGRLWRDLGDRRSNAGTVQIASSAASALIERVTNAIDGMLELKAEEHTGPPPTSPRQAAREWFGIPRGGIGELADKERRALASGTPPECGAVGVP
jgi:hypothetical protein